MKTQYSLPFKSGVSSSSATSTPLPQNTFVAEREIVEIIPPRPARMPKRLSPVRRYFILINEVSGAGGIPTEAQLEEMKTILKDLKKFFRDRELGISREPI